GLGDRPDRLMPKQPNRDRKDILMPVKLPGEGAQSFEEIDIHFPYSVNRMMLSMNEPRFVKQSPGGKRSEPDRGPKMPWSPADLQSDVVLQRNTYTADEAKRLRQRAREAAAGN